METDITADAKDIINRRKSCVYQSSTLPREDGGVRILSLSQRDYNTVWHGLPEEIRSKYDASIKLQRMGFRSILVGDVIIVVDQFAPLET